LPEGPAAARPQAPETAVPGEHHGRLRHGQRGGGKPVGQLGAAQWLTGGGEREH
jgi:hypothetical protein